MARVAVMIQHHLMRMAAPLAAAELCAVTGSKGLIAFVHPDGAARTAQRQQAMLLRLQARGFSTFDVDLLTPQESAQPERHGDVALLSRRLDLVLDHLQEELPAVSMSPPVGLFASDAAAAAMLRCAARKPRQLRALVSRSGHVELAAEVMGDVRVPTLLVVAAGDPSLVEANRRAFAGLRCEKRIDVVPRATHHFLEAGTLDVVAQLAGDWFAQHLPVRT